MNRMEKIGFPEGKWSLVCRFVPDAADGELFVINGEGKRRIRAEKQAGTVSFTLDTVWEEAPSFRNSRPSFTLSAPASAGQFRLMWLDASVRLYADDRLVDEEWPLGETVRGECSLEGGERMEELCTEPVTAVPPLPEEPVQGSAQFYKPGYHNAFVGDCMPFEHSGRYRLYYLFDRRQHGSKDGLGAHQWGQISSRDLKEWTSHPLAVGIDEQWEGSICTGSMIEAAGRVYAFYAVRAVNGTPAKLSWAVGDDGVHFEKGGRYFSLTDPYDPVPARDPKVFLGADGQYHMLVTTVLAADPAKPGCLAHLTSPDLENWTQQDPFYVADNTDHPECSDYFEWNGRYYLIYSNGWAGRYRMSASPFGPWEECREYRLPTGSLAVPKTACWNGRRLITGWMPQNDLFGGFAATFELIQRKDGTLGVRHVDEMMPELPFVRMDGEVCVSEEGCALPAAGDTFRMKGTVCLTGEKACGEILLRLGGDRVYRIRLDAANERVLFMRPDNPVYEDRRPDPTAENAGWLRKPFPIDLIRYDEYFMLCLPGDQLLIPTPDRAGGECGIALACREGRMQFAPEK